MASRIKRFFFIILIPLLTLMSMLQLWPNRATAATFTVINTNDGGAGSLRAAVAAAEANPGPDKITFDPGLDGSTISLTSGALTLSGTVEIDATNLAGGIEISGGDLDRVFFIESSAVVTLTHLTLISGTSQFGSGSCNTLCGGRFMPPLTARSPFRTVKSAAVEPMAEAVFTMKERWISSTP